MRWLFLLLAALTLAPAASGAVPLPSRVQTGLVTPSGNIACNGGPYRGKPLLACTVFSAGRAGANKVWSLPATGRVSVGFVAGDPATDYPKLGYGRSWSWRGIRCTSRQAGLTCRNPAGHGFFLSRASQRVF